MPAFAGMTDGETAEGMDKEDYRRRVEAAGVPSLLHAWDLLRPVDRSLAEHVLRTAPGDGARLVQAIRQYEEESSWLPIRPSVPQLYVLAEMLELYVHPDARYPSLNGTLQRKEQHPCPP